MRSPLFVVECIMRDANLRATSTGTSVGRFRAIINDPLIIDESTSRCLRLARPYA
jgi:hypothetical protein